MEKLELKAASNLNELKELVTAKAKLDSKQCSKIIDFAMINVFTMPFNQMVRKINDEHQIPELEVRNVLNDIWENTINIVNIDRLRNTSSISVIAPSTTG